MRTFLAFLVGLLVGSSVVGTAWAFGAFRWVDANGATLGTASNPVVTSN